MALKFSTYTNVSESDAKLIRELESKACVVQAGEKTERDTGNSEKFQEGVGVQDQGFSLGERPRDSERERREGRGGGIMNTTHISTIGTSPQVSCKSIGRAGPGRNKNVRVDLTAGDSYIPHSLPIYSSHANSRSNTVKIFPRTHRQTPPSRPIESRPLLAGTSQPSSPVKVLATSEFRSRVGASCSPRSPSVARGSFASREASVGLYKHKAVAKFYTQSEEGVAQSIPEGQAKRS